MLSMQDTSMQIDEFIKIVSIRDTEIQIQCKQHRYLIQGKNLQVKEFMQQQLLIEGKFQTIVIVYV